MGSIKKLPCTEGSVYKAVAANSRSSLSKKNSLLQMLAVDSSSNTRLLSILAKVTRDRFMLEMDEKYPQYGFATHKGYGTRAHYAALREFGPCPIHRRTFLKNLHAE